MTTQTADSTRLEILRHIETGTTDQLWAALVLAETERNVFVTTYVLAELEDRYGVRAQVEELLFSDDFTGTEADALRTVLDGAR